MKEVIILTAQLGLAFYIVSMVYLVLMYYAKNLTEKPNNEVVLSNSYCENHLAIIFNDYIEEEALLEKIQQLNQQGYKNYSAYFFIDSPIVEINNLKHIRIIRPNSKRLRPFGLLEMAKSYLNNDTQAIIILKSTSSFDSGFLWHMNQNLLEGKQVVQSQLLVNGINSVVPNYQVVARNFFNLIDRDAMKANGISTALWSHGFMIKNAIFDAINFNDLEGNDKALQAHLISKSIKINYEPHAKIFETALGEPELVKTRLVWATNYLFSVNLGFRLLLEGVKNPNLDKIIFGFNYLRPPLFLTLTASIVLAILDFIYMPNIILFMGVSIIGILISLFIILKPYKLISFFGQKELADSMS
jgi:hypothetical protein